MTNHCTLSFRFERKFSALLRSRLTCHWVSNDQSWVRISAGTRFCILAKYIFDEAQANCNFKPSKIQARISRPFCSPLWAQLRYSSRYFQVVSERKRTRSICWSIPRNGRTDDGRRDGGIRTEGIETGGESDKQHFLTLLFSLSSPSLSR